VQAFHQPEPILAPGRTHVEAGALDEGHLLGIGENQTAQEALVGVELPALPRMAKAGELILIDKLRLLDLRQEGSIEGFGAALAIIGFSRPQEGSP